MKDDVMNEKNHEAENAPIEKVVSGLAIFSLALSFIGVFYLPAALIALVLGIFALIRIKKNPDRLKGKSLATGGVCASLVIIAFYCLVMLPSLGRARELANQVKCGTHLNAVGKAIILYQNDFAGKCPPDLEVLLAYGKIVPHMLLCPSDDDAEFITGTKDELAAKGQIWPLDKESGTYVCYPSGISFVYRGSDLTVKDPMNMIVAYDKVENHRDGRRNVLYLNGYVQKVDEENFQTEIEKDNIFRRRNGLSEKPMD